MIDKKVVCHRVQQWSTSSSKWIPDNILDAFAKSAWVYCHTVHLGIWDWCKVDFVLMEMQRPLCSEMAVGEEKNCTPEHEMVRKSIQKVDERCVATRRSMSRISDSLN